MARISDLDHCRLEAIVRPDCIIESHEVSDAARGWRRHPITKVWRTQRILGRGGSGEVHLQTLDSDIKTTRTLKVILTRELTRSTADFQRELAAIIEFQKPKYRDAAVFVEFFGWFQNDAALFLAMEYMPLGDLEQNLREIEVQPAHEGSALSEEETQEVSRQILEGLNIMHAEGFAHRDLKPQNVFVVRKHPQWWVKLGDFGLSKRQTGQTTFRTQAGTQEYMAPELFHYVPDLDMESGGYTSAVDLWGLGCIIYRIITGAIPFPSLLLLRNYCLDALKVPLILPPSMGRARGFVEALLQPSPAKRPSAAAALALQWLTDRSSPNIGLQHIQSSISSMSIVSSQDGGYITASHKGLMSSYSNSTMRPTQQEHKQSLSQPSALTSSSGIGSTKSAFPNSADTHQHTTKPSKPGESRKSEQRGNNKSWRDRVFQSKWISTAKKEPRLEARDNSDDVPVIAEAVPVRLSKHSANDSIKAFSAGDRQADGQRHTSVDHSFGTQHIDSSKSGKPDIISARQVSKSPQRKPLTRTRTTRPVGEQASIEIRTLVGKSFYVNSYVTDTVQKMKRTVYEKELVPPDTYRLYFRGKELMDEVTLETYGISSGAVIHLAQKARKPEPGILEVKMLSGELFRIPFKPTDKVYDIKYRLMEREGFPVDQQVLVFKDSRLEDHLSVGEYGIQESPYIFLVLKQRET
ncbi:serine/threonine protein kinase [Helicocarpus griseus UAMH5409]|uniref:Serine/threonine protein kinase n=1 Tax=Helicocarpus griseus UAMH5409 TaxID=1447875 RepID=A0A2B7WHE4_9EURO|nr:serine/threonine protein kinase [Helicocarpus griseus UAMH5409]